MRVEIGPLQTTDVEAAARLHELAFPTFFLSSLGQPFLRQFYRGFLADPTAVAVVARDGSGMILGTVVGTTEPDGYFSRLLRRQVVGFVNASVRASLRSPRAVPRLLRAARYRGSADEGVDGALLSSICVSPDAQGAGVGRRLVAAWEQRAAGLGARAAYLSTDAVDNEPVNAFYQRCGWRMGAPYTTAEGRTMNLYTKELDPSSC
ncbi:GNAT family N-acetyltransferase [Flexivirga alba]|uniref:GNAT family N-acetyltransferase n=1 Tax=Flexivirga alba TaxID=702742 RepID=A0ABW2AG30_9MICO